METLDKSLSKKLPTKLRENLSNWLEYNQAFFKEIEIESSNVIHLINGTKLMWSDFIPGFGPWLNHKYIILVTKDKIHVVRRGFLKITKIITKYEYSIDSISSVDYEIERFSENITINFSDNNSLKLVYLDKGLSEPLKRIVKEGVDEFIT